MHTCRSLSALASASAVAVVGFYWTACVVMWKGYQQAAAREPDFWAGVVSGGGQVWGPQFKGLKGLGGLKGLIAHSRWSRPSLSSRPCLLTLQVPGPKVSLGHKDAKYSRSDVLHGGWGESL